MADLRNIIRQLAQTDGETLALVCTVDSVDEKARTVDCTPLNESAPLLGVNLQANQEADCGFCLYPEVGSFVIVGFVADGAAAVVLTTEKIKSAEICIGNNSVVINADNIVFNGGELGGLVKIKELTDKLNGLKNTVNDLVNAYNGHIHSTTATIGPSETVGILCPTTSQAKPADPFNKSDFEDSKITH